MKTLPTLTALALLTPTVAFAEPIMHTVGGDPLGYTEQAACFRLEYREEYVPGTSQSPGYVTNKRDKVEFPCGGVGGEPQLTQYPTRPSNTSNVVHPQPTHNHEQGAHPPVHVAHGYGYQQASSPPVIINNDRYPQNQASQSHPQQPGNTNITLQQPQQGDGNNCAAGTILGALAGGAAGAGLGSGNDLYWSIPLGMVGGSMVGCQMNGG